MSSPRINQLLVEIFRLIDCLVARFIIFSCVKLYGTICGRHHVDDGLVAAISELNGAPASLIEERLPHVIVSICHAVHDTTIAQNDDFLVAAECRLKESVFERHLHLHNIDLKLDLIGKIHFTCLNEGSALH